MNEPQEFRVLSDEELYNHHQERFAELLKRNRPLVDDAVAMLREELKELMPELQERIKENPKHWIGGRPDVECDSCKGTGKFRPLSDRAKDAMREWQASQRDPHVYGKAYYDKYAEMEKDPANLDPEETCRWCKGKRRCPEGPLHFGWGMAIRNLLRKKGFTDDKVGGNLDDYYVALVDAAAGMNPLYSTARTH